MTGPEGLAAHTCVCILLAWRTRYRLASLQGTVGCGEPGGASAAQNSECRPAGGREREERAARAGAPAHPSHSHAAQRCWCLGNCTLACVSPFHIFGSVFISSNVPPQVQRKLEEAIQRKNALENKELAYEHNPEAFASVCML